MGSRGGRLPAPARGDAEGGEDHQATPRAEEAADEAVNVGDSAGRHHWYGFRKRTGQCRGRREYEPLISNGDAHHSLLEGEPRLRIRPVALFSKTGTRERITHGHFSLRLVLARPKGDCAAAPV